MRKKALFPIMVALAAIILLSCENPVTPSTDAVISIAAIAGVTAPVAGATPVTAIIETAQYTGTVTWSGIPTTFAYSTSYTATITLTAKTGYTLTGVAANFFTVAGASSVANSASSGTVTAVFPSTVAAPDTVISIAAIAGVTAPVAGATPVTTISETDQYTGTVTWSGTPTTFTYSTSYTATITLTAKTGYTLSGVAANFFTVAGASSVANTASSGTVTAVFPSTAAEPDTVINIAAIAGVTAPVAGATPVTTISETDQYTGTVTWSGTPTTFAGGTAYTATITLTAKTGYTLSGVAANFFTVAGASSVVNSASSSTVTAVFPATDAVVINIAAIPGVTAPVAGATPVTKITATAQYTGTVTWSGTPTSFAGGTAYTATITLTAKTGYTLSGVAANFFTVAGASSVVNSASTGTVTAVFPATAAMISIAEIAGVTAPIAGATPVSTIMETDQYTGTIAWSGIPTTFAYSTSYTATITLTAKTGYTLTGVVANFFTVAGASSVANSASSGKVTAVFPSTVAPAVVSIAAIPGVTAPVTGATPVTTIMETDQYTGTVTWSPSVPTTFWSGTAYTATITLTAKTGYTLTGVTKNSFTVTGATATHKASSGVVVAVFSATASNLSTVSDAVSPNIGTLKAVQGGTFNNGTADMTVSSFRMSQYEITMEQFVAVTGLSNPSTYFTAVVNGPVQSVSWYHALVFCNRLSIKEGLTPVYTISSSTDPDDWGTIPTTSSTTWDAVTADWSASGYRLPTEAEWQFAARGGNSSKGYTYAGSKTIDDVAWYLDNASSTTHTVGGKTANELGLYDMSGNVWEFCWDWYVDYSTSAKIDYRGLASGTYRVIRGGSWGVLETSCFVAYRGTTSPSTQHFHNGFRVVRP